jgi:hypothetical protein
MSVEQPQVPSEDKGKTNPEIDNDVERLKATNKRLLEESQAYKEKYKSALKEKEDLESQKIAESGDIAQQLELEKKRSQKAMEELGKTKKKVVSQAVKDKISKYAGDVHSLDLLMRDPKLKEYLKQGLDEDNLEFNDESAKAFIDDVKKESPFLWRNSQPIGAFTQKPNGSVNVATTSADTAKMTATEIKQYMLEKFK